MDGLKQVAATADRVKVFPLPSVVLFPQTAVPLHIFEPRYRDLIRDALAGDRVMALGLLRDGWERDYYGRPALAPMCCAGVISEYDQMADGRYLIVLEGVVRARVVEELPAAQRYREIRVELVPDAPYEGALEPQLRQAVLELSSLLPQTVADEFIHQAACHAGGALADVVASSVVESVERRKKLLELVDVDARMRSVLHEVSALIARAAAGRPHPVLN